MKVVSYFLIITIVFAFEINAQDHFRFFINNLNMPLDNRGVLADVNISPHGSLGKYNDIGFLYSGGFYLSGYTGDSLWANGVAASGLVTDYQPGTVGSDPAAPENIIYVVDADDSPFGQSWQDWINAVNLGADFYDGDGDGIYSPVDKNSNGLWDPDEDKPDVLGDLTAWCVYNDGVPASERRWEAEPQGIEIHQTVFAYRNTNPQFSNTVNTIFIRYRINNTGTVAENLDSVFFSFYSDFDLGDPSDDLEGCDTLLAGGFVYNNGPDYDFGDSPPAVFHHFNQFPHTFIPGITFIDNNSNGIFDPGIDTPVDTAYSNRGPELGVRIIPGARNQNFSSSVYIWKGVIGYSDPSDIYHARNYMLGLTKAGTMLNPCTFPPSGVFGGVNCSQVNPIYWLSGEPVTNTGWIHTSPWDIRTMGTTGPFTLEENDQYDIILAYTLGEGTDAINSITIARENVIKARNAYLSNFGQFPVSVENDDFVINNFSLFQNYPNPFNPSTIIKYQIPDAGYVSLKVYDVLGSEVATLVNGYKNANSYEIEFNASGLASGIYFYSLNAGAYYETKKMILTK
ncbi:MAG: T9SS type A sorting domain-containing protein [Ignavibacteriaceae bacterium]